MDKKAYSGLVYYTISRDGEMAIELLPDTEYVYKCFVETAEGTRLWSNEYEFRTEKSPISDFKIESDLLGKVKVSFTTRHSNDKALKTAGVYITDDLGNVYKYEETVQQKYWYWTTINTNYEIGDELEIDFVFEKNVEYDIQAFVIVGGIEHKTNTIKYIIE